MEVWKKLLLCKQIILPQNCCSCFAVADPVVVAVAVAVVAAVVVVLPRCAATIEQQKLSEEFSNLEVDMILKAWMQDGWLPLVEVKMSQG